MVKKYLYIHYGTEDTEQNLTVRPILFRKQEKPDAAKPAEEKKAADAEKKKEAEEQKKIQAEEKKKEA